MRKKPVVGWILRKELIRAGIIKPAPRFFKIVCKDGKPWRLVVKYV